MSVERQPRPILGFVLSLIGGIISYIIGSFYGIGYMNLAPGGYTRFGGMRLGPSHLLLIALWFLIIGAIITVSAAMLYQRPGNHKRWGVIITVFSILCGNLFGLVGGVFAITWKPIKPRICMKCGRILKENYNFCPYCGKNLESGVESKKN